MKLLYISMILMAFFVCSFQQDTGGEDGSAPAGGEEPKTPAAGDGATNTEGAGGEGAGEEGANAEAPAASPTNPPAGGPESPATEKPATEKAGAGAGTGDNPPPEGAETSANGSGGDQTTGGDDEAPSFMADLSVSCKENLGYCYSPASTYADIKGKDMSTVNDESCDLAKKGKTCMTTENNGKKCTEEEYTKIEDALCFSPRMVASLVFVVGLSFLSKMLGQQ